MNSIDSTYGEEKFDITQNFKHSYTVGSADYKLYLSKDEILEDMECENCIMTLRTYFLLGKMKEDIHWNSYKRSWRY